MIPAVPSGTYTITVTLTGFKTAILNDVIASVAQTVTVKAVLELGALEETIIVTGASEIVQTQSTSVATTLSKATDQQPAAAGRGALDLVRYMPGVSTTTGSIRDSTVNGLPQSAINITLDGMNIQDNYAKSWDGMFTRVSPRLDAVEEVTMSTAAQGADMGEPGRRAGAVRHPLRDEQVPGQRVLLLAPRLDEHEHVVQPEPERRRRDGQADAEAAASSRISPASASAVPIIKDKAFFFVNYE